MRTSFWKQFLLVSRKNLILIWRSKLWTSLELILPLLLAVPIIYALTKAADSTLHSARFFQQITVSGNFADKDRSVGFTKPIAQKWCHFDNLRIAYSVAPDIPRSVVESFMNTISERYTDGSVFQLTAVFADTPALMEEILRKDMRNETAVGCLIRHYVGGVEFTEVNIKTGKLRYGIRLPNEQSLSWKLKENWRGGNPYAGVDFYPMPNEPPYWSYAFLSFQKALNDVFLQHVSPEIDLDVENETIVLERFPEPAYTESAVEKVLVFLPTMWAVFIFPTVIHAAREIAAECESGVKEFMRVMGLSSPVFFLTHAFIAWLKALIVCMFCAIPLSTLMTYISPLVFLFTVILYSLGVVAFALMCASLLRTANSVLKLSIILWAISVGLPYILNVTRNKILYCILCSLNINHVFRMSIEIMNDYCNRERELSLLRVFENSSIAFSLGIAWLMLLVDILWMTSFALIVDHLRSGADGWMARIFRCYKNGHYVERDQMRHLGDETDFVRQNSQADILVENMTKIWPDTGERAVDGMNLTAHRGQVTVLLGHNGAGKSTTFSVICGLTELTEGDVYVSETPVGLCPQGNALFDKLTVREHLWFFHELKGAKTNYKRQIAETLLSLKLVEKSNELACNLSGGMKRKLCVGLALIGDSRVLLLDEPTAGMDPGARRDVENLLQEIKTDRTVLLTTHYMDEAELLGDWVYIMCKGRAVTNGTPEFLKSKFGTGYILTIVVFAGNASLQDTNVSNESTKSVDPEEVKEAALQVAGIACSKLHLADWQIQIGEVHGRQVEIVLPESSKDLFPDLFKELELQQMNESLNVQYFGISLNTLEQVFLKVGEMAELDYIDSEMQKNVTHVLHDDERLEGFPLYLSQMSSLLRKRWLYMMRNWPQLISQLLVPIGLLLLTAYAANYSRTSATNEQRVLDFDSLGPVKAVLQVQGNRDKMGNAYRQLLREHDNFELLELPASADFNQTISGLTKELPALGIGVILRRNLTVALFNGVGYHSTPTVLNLIANARLRQKLPGGEIVPSIHVYDHLSEDGKERKVLGSDITDMILSPLLILAFALVTSTFVMFLVEERVCRFAHQQYLTPVSSALFWLASFLYDSLLYAVACAVFSAIFLVSGWMSGMMGYVILMWALYFWACCPFIYVVSFIFNSPSKANTMLVIWQIISSIMALILVALSSLLFPELNTDYVTSAFMFALPPYAMGAGILTIAQHGLVQELIQQDIWAWNQLGRPTTMMALFGAFGISLFVFFQSHRVHKIMSELWNYVSRSRYQKHVDERPTHRLKSFSNKGYPHGRSNRRQSKNWINDRPLSIIRETSFTVTSYDETEKMLAEEELPIFDMPSTRSFTMILPLTIEATFDFTVAQKEFFVESWESIFPLVCETTGDTRHVTHMEAKMEDSQEEKRTTDVLERVRELRSFFDEYVHEGRVENDHQEQINTVLFRTFEGGWCTLISQREAIIQRWKSLEAAVFLVLKKQRMFSPSIALQLQEETETLVSNIVRKKKRSKHPLRYILEEFVKMARFCNFCIDVFDNSPSTVAGRKAEVIAFFLKQEEETGIWCTNMANLIHEIVKKREPIYKKNVGCSKQAGEYTTAVTCEGGVKGGTAFSLKKDKTGVSVTDGAQAHLQSDSEEAEFYWRSKLSNEASFKGAKHPKQGSHSLSAQTPTYWATEWGSRNKMVSMWISVRQEVEPWTNTHAEPVPHSRTLLTDCCPYRAYGLISDWIWERSEMQVSLPPQILSGQTMTSVPLVSEPCGDTQWSSSSFGSTCNLDVAHIDLDEEEADGRGVFCEKPDFMPIVNLPREMLMLEYQDSVPHPVKRRGSSDSMYCSLSSTQSSQSSTYSTQMASFGTQTGSDSAVELPQECYLLLESVVILHEELLPRDGEEESVGASEEYSDNESIRTDYSDGLPGNISPRWPPGNISAKVEPFKISREQSRNETGWEIDVGVTSIGGAEKPSPALDDIRPAVSERCNRTAEAMDEVTTSQAELDEREDADILAEKTLAHSDAAFALRVQDLYMFYGTKPAVQGLNFAVESSDCFGLLGVNGAGKTTTFDILTGVRFPSSGIAKIGDLDVTEKIAIGYCPQFDAMLLDLTGRETLEIIAGLHGYRNPNKKADQVLEAVGMSDQGHKKVRHYSGGQRRKISVAIALLAKTKLVILDEPTAGIDPKARRDIWTQLSKVRDDPNSSLLLTSHSMDECEALCTKIAIINRGRMNAVGTSQHLKSKYGNSYVLTLVLRSREQREVAEEAVEKTFEKAKLKSTGMSLTLKWQIPRKSEHQWSSLWTTVSRLAKQVDAKDFCLTQSSLEETFLRLALENEEDESGTVATATTTA